MTTRVTSWWSVALASALFLACSGSDDTSAPSTGGNASSGGGTTTSTGPTRTELVSGGKRVSGSTFRMDVQLGNAIDQRRMQGGDKTLEGAAAVKR